MLNGVFCACLIMLVSHGGVQNVVGVSHFSLLLICSAACYSGLAAIQLFLSSSGVQLSSVARATIFHLLPSLR